MTGQEALVPAVLPDPSGRAAAWQGPRLSFEGGRFCPGGGARLDALPEGLSVREGQAGGQGGACVIDVAAHSCLAIEPVTLAFSPGTQADGPPAHVSIRLRESARLTLIERYQEGYSGGVAFDVTLEPQAKLVHGRIVPSGPADVLETQLSAHLGAGAFYDHTTLIAGQGRAACEADIALEGPLAEARLQALLLLSGAGQAGIQARVGHHAPHGLSRQIVRAALADKAKGSFAGRVFVGPEGLKTDAYQMVRALLLSDKTDMQARPELEIYADDVKCTHGAALGDLDEAALFYLQARGIPLRAARALLVEAFARELLSQTIAPEIGGVIEDEVKAWLARL